MRKKYRKIFSILESESQCQNLSDGYLYFLLPLRNTCFFLNTNTGDSDSLHLKSAIFGEKTGENHDLRQNLMLDPYYGIHG